MNDPLVDLYDEEPLRAVKPLPSEDTNALLASALETTASPAVDRALVAAVFQRELPRGESVAMREALRYISTVENYAAKQPTKHTDLLPLGHPLSSDRNFSREDVATYFSQIASDADDQKLIYEVLSSTPNSTERKFLINKIQPNQYAIVAAIEVADGMTPSEEIDWDEYAKFMANEEYLGEDFSYISTDEDGNEVLVKPETPESRVLFYGTIVFPTDPEKNIDITQYDE